MSCVTKMTAKPSCSCSSLICTISERWPDDVEGRRRLVHDDQLGVNSSAIAIIARCRIPPDSWCG
jgi:hypothetical protein